jgi:uncharacterized lipoprotein
MLLTGLVQMKKLLCVALVAVAVTLSACGAFRVTCNDMSTYAASEELSPLKVPAGLEAPDTRTALKIPALNEPERVRTESEGCLESPPAYSAPRAEPKKT